MSQTIGTQLIEAPAGAAESASGPAERPAPAEVLGLFPGLLGPGGVQRASRHVAAVLAAYAETRGMGLRLLSLNDELAVHRIGVNGQKVEVRGFGRNKGRFTLAAAQATRAPRLVVATHPHLAPVAWLAGRRRAGSRTVVVAHGIEVWNELPAWRRWSLKRVDAVLAPSSDTAAKLTAVQRVVPWRIQQVPWALDPEFLAERDVAPLVDGRERIILTVTRLAADERYKGVDTLIRIMPRVLAAVREARLWVVGDGDDRPRLEALARSLGLTDRVRFLGAVSQARLVEAYRRCDVFALPSSGEGFGLVFLEAMSFGKPVIGGAHGGTMDLIEDGSSGYLVRDGDDGRLASILGELLSDPELRDAIGYRARAAVQSRFLFGHFAERFEQALEKICAF